MEVYPSSPLPVTTAVWQPRQGACNLTVVCKATYLLRPTESPLAPEQDPLHGYDGHWDGNPAASVSASSDLVPLKPHAEVMLVGHSHAPGQQPVRSLVTRLIVGEVDKAVEVVADRYFGSDGVLREGPRFTSMSLRYERAAGGPGTINPVGVRHDARDGLGKLHLPNVQPPGTSVSSPDDFIEPIGYGPIAAGWPARLEKLGRHAAGWSADQWRRAPLPEDIDFAYFNAAPRDQRLNALREDTRIVLENLHPEHPRLATNLGGGRPQIVVEARGSRFVLPLRCDTLWIDTDRGVCTLTWRGQMPLQHPGEAGRVSLTLERAASMRMDGPAPEREDTQDEPPRRASRTLVGAAMPKAVAAALPFAPAGPGNRGDAAVQTFRSDPLERPGPALPFVGQASAERAPEASGWAEAQPRAQAQPAQVLQSLQPAQVVQPAPMQPASMQPPLIQPPLIQPPLVQPALRAPGAAADSPWAAGPSRDGGIPQTLGAAVVAAASASVAAFPETKDGGALAASNAAAAPALRSAAPRVDAAPARATPAAGPRAAARVEPRELVHILWLDPAAMPRIRKKAPWRTILDAMEQDETVDPEADDPRLAKDPAEIEDRRDVFAILVRGEAVEGEGVNDALAAGARDDGRHVPALALCVGELSFPFDELETLKATVVTVSPLVGGDENLKGVVDVAKEFLKTPDLRSAPAVAEGLTTRVREAFAQGRRAVAPGYLDAQTERVLLEQRHYQRREVFGGAHLRALLVTQGASAPVPTYLPEAVAKKLPLYQRFRARLIAEVQLGVDQYETHPAALRVLAVGRLGPAPVKR